MISPQRALKKLGRGPAKSLGQHFLMHHATAEKIAAAINPEPGDVVVEIGAGLGALTVPLSHTGARVLAVEIDAELAAFLREELFQQTATDLLTIECMDVLQMDFTALSESYRRKLKIIGNLPYNISSPILFKLMEQAPAIEVAVLMLQNEVAQRVLAESGSRDYGILSVMAAYYTERSRFMRLKPTQFHPPPRVDSLVIRLWFRDCPLTPRVQPEWLLRVVKAAFAHRRKTLRNSLLASNLSDLAPTTITMALEKAAIEPRRRPESLGLEEYLRLAHELRQGEL